MTADGEAGVPHALVAVDVGGTTVKGVVASSDGDVLARRTIDTFGGGRSAVESIIALIDSLQSTARAIGRAPDAISVCTPGVVVGRTGMVTYAANLRWSDLPLQRILADQFALPVHIDHDARSAAIAEAAATGLPPEKLDLLFIPIGTGVSSAILVGGRPLGGATGSAGEIGHVSVYPDGEPCSCGQFGCVEAYSSAPRILARYRRAGGTGTSVPAIVAALGHDPIARQVWVDAIDALARGIAAAIATVDPASIVIGGGLSQAGDALLVPLRHRLAELLTWRPAPEIRVSALGSAAGLIGAALLAAPEGIEDRHRFALTLRDRMQSTVPA